MFSLATISKMNTRFEIAKSRRVAQALNNPGGHAKSDEKGQKPWLKEILADSVDEKKKWPAWDTRSHRVPVVMGGVDNPKLPRISSVVH